MTRRVIEQIRQSVDRELLQTVIVYEPGVNKQMAKAESRYSKRHKVLLQRGNVYEFMSKRA